MRDLVNDLEEESYNQLKTSWLTYNRPLLEQKWDHITRALNLITRKIMVGDYRLAETYQLKTNQEVRDLIQ